MSPSPYLVGDWDVYFEANRVTHLLPVNFLYVVFLTALNNFSVFSCPRMSFKNVLLASVSKLVLSFSPQTKTFLCSHHLVCFSLYYLNCILMTAKITALHF